MRAAVRIAIKDLKRSIRDRSAIALTVVAPLALAFILSSVLGNADESSFSVDYAVADLDGGHIARTFVDETLGGMEEEGFADISEVDSAERAERMIEDDDIGAAFVIPEGFSDAVEGGRATEILVLKSPDARISAEIARSIARGFANELNAVSLSIATVMSGTDGEPPPEDLQQAAQSTTPPARVAEDVAGSREFDTKTFFAAGMAVFFLFFTAQFGAVSLLTERKEGTLARLLAAPLSTRSIIGGKALYGYVLGAGSMAILIIASTLLMDASWGDPAGVALLVAVGVFAAMGIQSVVTTLAKTDEQASGYGSIVGVTLGLLGGTFFPLSQAPGLLQNLSYATPHAWLMRGFGDLSGGAGTIADTLPSLGALLAIGVVTAGAALLRSRNLVVR